MGPEDLTRSSHGRVRIVQRDCRANMEVMSVGLIFPSKVGGLLRPHHAGPIDTKPGNFYPSHQVATGRVLFGRMSPHKGSTFSI